MSGALAVALATLLCFRAHLELSAVVSVFLLIVVLHSLAGDFVASILVSVLAALSLDYYFTHPLFSFQINDLADDLALLAFAITVVIITRLVTRVRAQAKSAYLHRDRFNRLYQLSQQLVALEPEDASGEGFLEPFRRLFGVSAVCVFDGETLDQRMIGVSLSGLAGKTRDAYIQARDLNDATTRSAVRCLRLGGTLIGAIGFEGLRHPEETAGPLTALTAAHLARIKAFHDASSAAAAAQAEVFRSAVLDALAHEFKTPLATILAAAGGLRESGPLATEQAELADIVENEAVRLGNLTSRLIRTARLDREDIRPRLEWVNLAALVRRVAGQHAARSSDRQVGVVAHEPVAVYVDPELLQLTLGQLIENACKYSEPGSTVTIGMERHNDFVDLKVSNNGSSIPPPEQRRIFDRFYRGANAKRSTAGSGLGLYVARKIAAAHGGNLELETGGQSGGTVTFSLRLPAAKEAPKHALAT